jgi:hypothetical protein
MCRLLGFDEVRALGRRWESFRPSGSAK